MMGMILHFMVIGSDIRSSCQSSSTFTVIGIHVCYLDVNWLLSNISACRARIWSLLESESQTYSVSRLIFYSIKHILSAGWYFTVSIIFCQQADILQYQTYFVSRLIFYSINHILSAGWYFTVSNIFCQQADILQYQSYSHSDDMFIILKSNINTNIWYIYMCRFRYLCFRRKIT